MGGTIGEAQRSWQGLAMLPPGPGSGGTLPWPGLSQSSDESTVPQVMADANCPLLLDPRGRDTFGLERPAGRFAPLAPIRWQGAGLPCLAIVDMALLDSCRRCGEGAAVRSAHLLMRLPIEGGSFAAGSIRRNSNQAACASADDQWNAQLLVIHACSTLRTMYVPQTVWALEETVIALAGDMQSAFSLSAKPVLPDEEQVGRDKNGKGS